MLCISCSNPIPAARLRAMPNAKVCIICLRSIGDVPIIKRFDEVVGEDTVTTYFLDTNSYIKRQIERTGVHVPSAKIMINATESPVYVQPAHKPILAEQSVSEILDQQQVIEE